MKLLFLMRYDYKEKSGGDVVQVESYMAELSLLGHLCQVKNTLELSDIESNDAFFLVNIDRPIETIEYFKKIRKNSINKKIYIIPIHHPVHEVTKFEQRVSRGLKNILSKIFTDYYTREKIKNISRFRKSRYLFTAIIHLFKNYKKNIKSMIDECDGLIYISNGERESVEKDFCCVPRDFIICYNAVNVHNFIGQENNLRKGIIIVGRIEQRKNILNILKHAVALDCPITVVGKKNQDEKEYCEKFDDFLKINKNIRHLNGVPHLEVLKLISSAKLIVNASYFEVNPLVDLEAALVGTDVITTKNSYTRESIPNAFELDPYDLTFLPLYVKTIFENPGITLENLKINTNWKKSAESINNLLVQKSSNE